MNRALAIALLPALLLPGLALVLPGSALADIPFSVEPDTSYVAPDSVFVLDLFVDAGSADFNAYETTVTFDPGALEFLETTPVSLQEGPLMTGACGTRWHRFDEVGGTITLTHALLCAGVSVAGPGTVYRLTFKALTPGVETWVEIQEAVFADAGVQITPVTTADALVTIGAILDVPGDRTPRAGTSLRAWPNPMRSRSTLELSLPTEARVSVTVFDILGREVRHLAEGSYPAGDHRLDWDGTRDDGTSVPAGVYLYRVTHPEGVLTRRVLRLP